VISSWHQRQNAEEIVRKALKNLVALAVAGFALSVLPDAGFACGTRHFYNNSNTSYYLHFDKSTCSLPNGPNVSDCTVPPGGVAEIHYANPIGGGDRFGMNSQGFDVNIVSCHIDHPNQGNTGNVALNEPANGDVTTCGRGWACK
jgi:hypothetical protein